MMLAMCIYIWTWTTECAYKTKYIIYYVDIELDTTQNIHVHLYEHQSQNKILPHFLFSNDFSNLSMIISLNSTLFDEQLEI